MTDVASPPPSKNGRKANRRGAARLAAVQALYQMDIAHTGVNEILAQFESYWIGQEVEGNQYLPAEAAFFRSVVEGVVEPGEPFTAELHGTLHPSRTVPGPWQDALSEYVGEPLTLLWSEGGAQDRGNDRGGWASLISRGSLERLRAEAGSQEPVDGRRFRMLFEIEGVGPHEEDSWLGLQVAIGEAVIVPLGDVGRCVVTTCDPDTAVSDFNTLKLLAAYRREGVVEPLPFGVYCDVAVPGRVRVGDPVRLAVPDAVQA